MPEEVAAACWEFIVNVLAHNPRRAGKALRADLAGRFSARRGGFRVVYEIHDDTVVVRFIDVRHRRDVYR
ncbi:type II toxin-antitoxin system RelE/ParE family toxin [Mycolicibacillus trivialis]